MDNTNLTKRYYLFAGLFLVMAFSIVFRLIHIQFSEGVFYKKMAAKTMIKNFVIIPNRGNLYADDGSLLATSINRFDLRFDTQSVRQSVFDLYFISLCDSLSGIFGHSPNYYIKKISRAKSKKNRYLLLARKVNYSEYLRVKKFPIFNLGTYKGGLIVEQKDVRELPLNGIGARTIGYEHVDEKGRFTRVGLEGAFGKYLRGKTGKQLKQRIAKGKWKPINDSKEVEPKDGLDVQTTVDINIQDLAHQTLLKQLKKFQANHGCVVVMEVKTGSIKAISNLGKTSKGNYYEKLNYAVGESSEPGSTFKLMSLVAALDQRIVDTTAMVNTGKGVVKFYDKIVRDSKRGGHGLINLAQAFEVSSNVGFAKIITKYYGKNPSKFVDKLYKMGLNDRLGLPISGEGIPYIPHPKNKSRWYGTTLPWMAYGYGVSLTPLQILTFYNAVINNGMLVKPRFIKTVEKWNKIQRDFTKKIDAVRICSYETSKKARVIMRNVVQSRYGTGHKLKSEKVLLAGKSGTCQKNYGKDKLKNLGYISSFVGYFPANNPKYSCIVVIDEPNKAIGYYGAQVAGPVFKEIAEKMYVSIPDVFVVNDVNKIDAPTKKNFNQYYAVSQKYQTIMPNLKNMPAMDAIALLENMGLQVKIYGQGNVTTQSIPPGKKISRKEIVVLKLS